MLFANHPYHVTAATKARITATSRADLQEIFAQRFRPDQAMLVAVGDFRNDSMLAAIKAKFGSWKAPANAPKAAPPEPSTAVEHAVFLVARPGSIQSTLELATFAPRLGDPSYATAQVANALYGGEFSSRLVSNIREDKGYTYSPYSFLRSFQMSAELVSRADVRNEVTAPALNEIEYELNRLATTSPSNEELSSAKRYLVGSEALELPGSSLARSPPGDTLDKRITAGTDWNLRATSDEHDGGGRKHGCAKVLRSLSHGNHRRRRRKCHSRCSGHTGAFRAKASLAGCRIVSALASNLW